MMLEPADAGRQHLTDADWQRLLHRIKEGRCTPFIGSGASGDSLPSGSNLAADWAKESKYPLYPLNNKLYEVAQYIAVKQDDIEPKLRIQREFKRATPPNFSEFDEPHAVLAELPFPLYMTTNYDLYMSDALRSRGKNPRQEVCRWWQRFPEDTKTSIFESEPLFEPSPDDPVVFHMHGNLDVAESIVVTEDDYLTFLIKVSKKDLLPARITRALTASSLLFLGYSLTDWNFLVLLHSLTAQLENAVQFGHVSVLSVPNYKELTKEQLEEVQKYRVEYFRKRLITVHWSTCREFAAELKQRWDRMP
jgi:hypothetical protein